MEIRGPHSHHGHGHGQDSAPSLINQAINGNGPQAGISIPGVLSSDFYGNAGDNGGEGGDHGDAAQHGRPGGSGSTQAGAAVHQAYSNTVTGNASADGPDAHALNRPMELRSGVAVARMLSHGGDAVPAGIARQLGDVAQHFAGLTNTPAANANPNAHALHGDARLQGTPQAQQAAGNHSAAATSAQATPSATQTATATPVPQAARGGEALATALRPEATNVQQTANAHSASAATAAAGNTAAQASAAALAAGSVAQPNALAMPQGSPMVNNPTVIPTNFINPHAAPQGTTFSRDAVIPVDNRLSLAMQREGAYTGTGPARERLRGDVRQLPRRMNHWLARMGLVKPDAFARHQGVDAGEQGLQQWLYWILAIVAFLGCGLMLASLLPSGTGLLEGGNRTTAGGFGLVAGIAAGLGAWWLRSQWRKSAAEPESF